MNEELETVLEPVLEAEELTDDLKAQQAENDKNFYTLKAWIETMVDEMYKLDIPLAILEIQADDLFKNYRRIQASKSLQWDTFIQEKTASEEKFYSLKATELTYAETSQAVGDTDAV